MELVELMELMELIYVINELVGYGINGINEVAAFLS